MHGSTVQYRSYVKRKPSKERPTTYTHPHFDACISLKCHHCRSVTPRTTRMALNLNLPSTPSAQWLNCPAPPVEVVLQRVFRLAQSTWARDFLFFPNANVDAGILTSPLHLQHKVAGQIRLDMKAERPPGPYNNEPYMDPNDLSLSADDRLYANWIIVPAFNFGSQGACYFMNKMCSESPSASGDPVDDNGAVRSALYRIITDDITGEVLYVGDIPETDKFQVVHMRHVNGAFHERVMCFFEGSVFRAALNQENGNGLSLPHLAKALTLCIHTRETRMCIMCGSHPSALCECRVLLKQAEHPHDLRYYAHNTRTHLGQYSGKEYLMYMKNGMEIARRPRLLQHRTNCEVDRDAMKALRVWAVQDRLGNVVGRTIATAKDRAVAQAIGDVNEKSFSEFVDDLASVDARIEASAGIRVQGQWNPQLQSTEVDISNTNNTNVTPLLHTDVHIAAHTTPTPSVHTAYIPHLRTETDIAQALEATHLATATLPLPASPNSPPPAPLLYAPAPMHYAPRGRRRPAVRERRLLPRGNRAVTPATQPQDRELELRIRKREAARRSDQRRLAKVQQLQEETVKLERRAAALRERQAQLRDENEALRREVASLGLLADET